MSRKIRIGLVGTSWWAESMFVPALRSHPQAELAAICGRNRARAEEVAANHGIPAVYTDYREMMAQGGLEAMIVAAPDTQHHAMTLAAVQAGLHVLCEKPLAMNSHDAWEMYTAAQTARVKHMVLFTYRWMPFFRYFRDLVDQGYVGRLYHAELRYLSGFGRAPEYRWRYDQDRANGILGDLGSHVIDLARWLVGDIRRVQARLGVFVDRPGPEGAPLNPANDSALLLVEFATGAHGVLQASAVAHLAEHFMQQQISLYGEDGTLEINIPWGGPQGGAVIRAARAQDEQFQTLPVPDSYWAGVDRSDPFAIFTSHPAGARLFVDAILEDRAARPDFGDGYQAQRVIDAAMESHRTGQAVDISPGP